jgi:ABC-2 type transport system ATP-binding protein
MNASNGTVIQTHDLTKTFKGVNALQSLNLNVRKNSIFGFLGPNGAGKTTTIKLLLGLSRPTSGSASIFGLDIVKDSTRIRRRVGYLAQEPRYYEHLTARQTLRFAARFFFTGPQKAIEDRIQNTLQLVGLEDKADRPIKGFSGGERQRLGIAQAQINFPDLLILDEPAASLDPMGRHDVLEVMERLRKHTTIFYSTHILSDVQRVSDTVAILKKGQLIAEAPIETLLAGSGGMVYSIVVKGHSNGLQTNLSSLPWVSSVTNTPSNNGRTTWQVTVTDEALAESQLLPSLICDEHLAIVEFGRKKYELEEVFMNIVEGGEHGR